MIGEENLTDPRFAADSGPMASLSGERLGEGEAEHSYPTQPGLPEQPMSGLADLKPGESGQGYALRMAQENGLIGLPEIKKWLGKSRFATLDRIDAPLLHQWFGADRGQLEFALGDMAIGRKGQGLVYLGQPISRDYFLNKSYPRVCLRCIDETGYCRLDWDFGLVVACPIHGELLTEQCDCCAKRLTWNRARLANCVCGAPLNFFGEPLSLPSLVETQIAAWVRQHTANRKTDHLSGHECGLMTMVKPLSLNGAFHIAFALGTAALYVLPAVGGIGRPKSPLAKAQMVLGAANQMAERILNGDSIQLTVRRPTVVINLLAEACHAEFSSADQSLAQSVFFKLFGHTSKARWSGVHPAMSQISMF